MISPIGWIIIWIGICFNLLGTIGLVRFPDIYNRLQTSTKCVTLGSFGLMIGIFLLYGFSQTGIKALICGVFLLLTNPVGAHAILKGSLHYGIKLWKGSIIDKYGADKLGGEQIEKEEKV
uniref:Na+/H+ antiporter subunit G n=1 Tax=candidate division WOR-3 bacterium TaxID=2052148 RepID=A0A7V0Z5S7_UNCW3